MPPQVKIDSQTVFINKNGVKQLCIKSRMPKAVDFAKFLNIDITNGKVQTKEQKTIRQIMKAFSNEEQDYQFSCGYYRIDLYFPIYKLAIECDENGHKDRNENDEKEREKYLRDRLDCKFIRYNPDDKDFDIFDVINQIHVHMKDYLIKI